jgi:S-DNA-T family DNA segregation ATPase FtsK/SpoIIIE
MPLLKPTIPPKKSTKPAGKTFSPKGQPSRGKNSRKQEAPPPPALSWWDQLSPERRLDVVGIILAFTGILIFLGLVSAKRSLLIGGVISFLAQIFGWGVYVLPIGLLVFGLWLVFRKIEKIPPLSLERAVGSVILFLWFLTILHAFVSNADNAEAIALTGIGGGYIGGLFQRALWFALGAWGAIIALTAWLIIGIITAFDISVQDLFRWLEPLNHLLRMWLNKPLTRPADPQPDPVSENGFTPLALPESPVTTEIVTNLPTKTTSVATVIHWTLPNVGDILDEGDAPSVNEDFIQQRARLIEETLASFSAPVQVVEISRGPSITQFGVEPLFVETRNGRTRVHSSACART